jgi:PAS domain S-box-containing protein
MERIDEVDGEARLSVALGAADIVGVWDGDLVAGLVFGDANFARIYGVDPEVAARGVPRGGYFQHIHPDDLPAVEDEIRRLFAGALDYANEHRILRPDGAIRWVLTRGRLVRDAAGTPLRFAGISVDITDRRRAEARQAFLLELADRLRALSDAPAIVDAAVQLLGKHFGTTWAGYGQVQPDDSTVVVETFVAGAVRSRSGTHLLDSFGAHNIVRHRQGLAIVIDDVLADPRDAAVFGGGEVRSLASIPLIRDGRLRATLFVGYASPRRWAADDVGLIESVAGRLWEAIERARAEKSLRELNASLEQQVEIRQRERDRTWRLAPVVMVVADAGGVLLAVNPAWTSMLGWGEAETIGRDVMVFVAPEDRPAGEAGMARLFKGEAVIDYQLAFLTRGGERRRIAWTTVPEGGHLYGYGRDITDQVVAEERLRQSQKMEAVGQLTGGLAHDFNNLLTGIMGGLELLQTRLAQGRLENLDRYIDAAQAASRRAASLTHRLLAFSRQQTLVAKPTDVNRLVAGMQELVRRAVGPAVLIRLDAAEGLWTTLVDQHQLENALLNLCINARDAMPEGGVLAIETENHDVDDEAAREADLLPGSYVALRVIDSGVGMAEEVMRRAFDPFFTTKPLGGGTGLGLSMIYGFARQSGGQVRIASEVGRGTKVTILLPRHHGAAADEEDYTAGLAETPAQATAGETVLVVDDEDGVRMLVCEVLEERGYDVIEASDGAGAMAVLQAGTPVDLLVTDIGLPGGMNGRHLADAARRLRPGLLVLFITGYEETEAGGTDVTDVGMDVLTKPFTAQALFSRITGLIGRRGASPHPDPPH